MTGRPGARPPLRADAATTLPNRKMPYRTPEEELAAREAAVEAQLQVWRQHLPKLFTKLTRIPDLRRAGSVRHQIPVVLFYGLLLFVCQYASRREANRNATSPPLFAALHQVFPDITSIPHFDTVERLLRTIPAETWETVLRDRVTTLLRKHGVHQYLVQHRWVVAVDGSEKFARHQPFAPEALRQQFSDTTTRYRVYVVEAVLVVESGVTLPLTTVFAENDPAASPDTQQDCERKAFRRLARRLKEWVPRRRLLLVLDGLYPNGPLMTLCHQYHWDYLIVLPRDSLPQVWAEVEGLRRLDTAGEQRRAYHWGDRIQEFTWVNAILDAWREAGRTKSRRVHVALCHETWVDARGSHNTDWAWLSGQPLTAQTIVSRCNRAGRHRWAIEANFLVEKRHGDHFEHPFSYDWTALKGWHYLMKLAHLLNVLTLWTEVGAALREMRGYHDAIRSSGRPGPVVGFHPSFFVSGPSARSPPSGRRLSWPTNRFGRNGRLILHRAWCMAAISANYEGCCYVHPRILFSLSRHASALGTMNSNCNGVRLMVYSDGKIVV